MLVGPAMVTGLWNCVTPPIVIAFARDAAPLCVNDPAMLAVAAALYVERPE